MEILGRRESWKAKGVELHAGELARLYQGAGELELKVQRLADKKVADIGCQRITKVWRLLGGTLNGPLP